LRLLIRRSATGTRQESQKMDLAAAPPVRPASMRHPWESHGVRTRKSRYESLSPRPAARLPRSFFSRPPAPCASFGFSALVGKGWQALLKPSLAPEPGGYDFFWPARFAAFGCISSRERTSFPALCDAPCSSGRPRLCEPGGIAQMPPSAIMTGIESRPFG